MAKESIKKIGEQAREAELGTNDFNINTQYTSKNADENVEGTPIDKAQRLIQISKNDYTKENPYNSNSIDW